MRSATLRVTLWLGIAATLGLTGCWLHREAAPLVLELRLHPFVGSEPLVLHEPRYRNPGGEGRFQVRDFQFFLSNIRLVSETGAYAEAVSYHLVRFDGEDAVAVIVLSDIPRRAYQRIELGIGVDPAANRSLQPRGDLDPNGRMAWTWEVGYKFMLFEGTLVRDEASDPLVYHVGFDESYRTISIDLRGAPLDSRPARLDFRVDILRLFQAATTVDMAALPSVKFDRGDAARLAGNFTAMVSPMWPAP